MEPLGRERVNGETEKFRCGRAGQFPVRHMFPVPSQAPLIVHGRPVSCPFNFPSGNLKQQLSHIGLFFICYQNIDAKNNIK